MSAIQDFKIDIPKEKLADLQKRLEMTRWPEKETPDDWTQGIPLSYMKEIHEYWLNDYDWKKHEKNRKKSSRFLPIYKNSVIYMLTLNHAFLLKTYIEPHFFLANLH